MFGQNNNIQGFSLGSALSSFKRGAPEPPFEPFNRSARAFPKIENAYRNKHGVTGLTPANIEAKEKGQKRIISIEQLPDGTHICTFIFYEKDGVQDIKVIPVRSAFEIGSLHDTLIYEIEPDVVFSAGEMRIVKEGKDVQSIEYSFESGSYMFPYMDKLKEYNKNVQAFLKFRENNTNSNTSIITSVEIMKSKKQNLVSFLQSKGFPKPTFYPGTFISKNMRNAKEMTNYKIINRQLQGGRKTRKHKTKSRRKKHTYKKK
jgi:hypothetical protein